MSNVNEDDLIPGAGEGKAQRRRVLRLLDHRLKGLMGPLVSHLAVDRSDRICAKRLLVLAPHPDDETLACGGTILRTVTRGGQVVVAVATDGRYGDPSVAADEMAQIRRNELDRAVQALGLGPGQVECLGFEDASLATNQAHLAELVQGLITRLQPDVVIAPCPWDLHPDHAALGQSLRSLGPLDSLCFGYLVWGWEQPVRLMLRAFRPKGSDHYRAWLGWPVAVDVSGHLEAKATALACHHSQLAPDAGLGNHLIGGTGPLTNDFLRRFGGPREIFFPFDRGSTKSAPTQQRRDRRTSF